MQKIRDGLSELPRTFGVCHGKREAASQAMARHAKFLEKMRTAAESVLRKDRMSEAGFDEALDGFRVVRLHNNAGRDAQLFEIAINDKTNVAALRVEEEWDAVEFRRAEDADVAAADFAGGRAHDEELFIKKRNELEVGFRYWKRDESEIKTAIEQACHHFFSDSDCDANFRVGKLLPEFAQRAAQLVNERGDSGGEMKRTEILG